MSARSGGRHESRKVVTTVESIQRDWRPSALASACAPAAALVAPPAQVYVLGQPAVEIHVRTAPTFGLDARSLTTNKINNYMGSTSAMGEGMATSHRKDQKVSVQRVQTVAGDKVKGGNARGIPPRGRPV